MGGRSPPTPCPGSTTALQEALAQATAYVYIVGWSLTPHIPLARHHRGALIETQLLDLLSEAAQCVPVRILLWSAGMREEATLFLQLCNRKPCRFVYTVD